MGNVTMDDFSDAFYDEIVNYVKNSCVRCLVLEDEMNLILLHDEWYYICDECLDGGRGGE